MNSLSNQIPDIPLHCNVCPKKPTFSDVSHLLTHIASKGHLSCYYKIKVKASNDDEAKNVIDDYDDWYETYEVEGLMRDRMSQKDKRRSASSNGTSRRASSSTARNTPVRNTPAPAARPRQSQSNRLRDNMHLVDPALNRRFSQEMMGRSDTPNSMYSANSMPRDFATHFQGPWAHTNGYPFSNSPLVKQESLDSDDFKDDQHDAYDPQPRRQSRHRRHTYSDSVPSFMEDEYVDDLANDSSKLKGTVWPGMDHFDAATMEMRRKRNQKKAVSVLHALQATSEIVEPIECVHDATWVLRKEREITGNPESEDDRIEGESEPELVYAEKKRPRRPRQRPALSEKSVNSGRVTRSRAQPHHPSTGGRKKRSSYVAEMEGDDDLTYRQPPRKRRTGLSIHRDNTGPDITFDNPASLNALTASFRHPFQQAGQGNPLHQSEIGHNLSDVTRAHDRETAWGQAAGTFRPSNNGSAPPMQNFANFGQYFHHNAVPHAGAMTNPLMPHPQQLGFGQLQQANAMFPHHGNSSWDAFGLDHPDFGFLANADANLNTGTEMNPLFFSSNVKEDDEATISVGSEHEG